MSVGCDKPNCEGRFFQGLRRRNHCKRLVPAVIWMRSAPPAARAFMHPAARWSACLAALAALAPAARADGPVSFRNEVMAVLSRGGCNAGACHGNQNGKNGFKLSLRGQDADFDLAALTRHTLARRTD